jgi:exodeoxyribonuclease VII small subunit
MFLDIGALTFTRGSGTLHPSKGETVDFEKNLKRLEDIVAKLEDGELQLEESLKLFEEGITISRACNQKLTEAENRVKLLLSVNSDSTELTKDFSPE